MSEDTETEQDEELTTYTNSESQDLLNTLDEAIDAIVPDSKGKPLIDKLKAKRKIITDKYDIAES